MTARHQRVATVSGRLICFCFWQCPKAIPWNTMENLFIRLGEQAPTGKSGPSQHVWEFPGAPANICRAAIPLQRCRRGTSGRKSQPFSTRLVGGGWSQRSTLRNRGTPDRRQPGMTSANNRQSAGGAMGRLGWMRRDEFRCWDAHIAPAPTPLRGG